MKKLALTDEILLRMRSPPVYRREINAVMKDKNKVDIRFAMCFPDVYEIGMSHLGIQILYDMFNQREDVWCETRLFSHGRIWIRIMQGEAYPALCPGVAGSYSGF